MDQAFATPGPVVIECVTDPNELPMPPQLSADEVKNVQEALAKGQPDAEEIARVTAKGRVREMV
jgi:hypothetical protein